MATSSEIFLPDLLERQRIRIRIFMIPAKSAERALGRADIGVIDVPVDDVGAVVLRMHPLRNAPTPSAPRSCSEAL